MKRLEREPATYEKLFTGLTGGINIQVHEWILEKLAPGNSVLEIGSGPGTLAFKMSSLGCSVVAFEKNPGMINEAKKQNDATPHNSRPIFKWGTVRTMDVETGVHDFVVSTFVLSELRPFEQQIFLRKAWNSLKPGGKLIIAEEFEPTGLSRVAYNLKRWVYKRRLGRLRSGEMHPLRWFEKYTAPVGFKTAEEKQWARSIKGIIYEKPAGSPENAGFYRPPPLPFKGARASLRSARCLLGGQIDHVPVEPGLYEAGNPGPTSPVIVTANYDYTYIKVMSDLDRQGIDAWVLCVDSRGINVWCAARGGDFGNSQLEEAVQATNIADLSRSTVLLLPQLSAGGIESPKLSKNTTAFPFSVRFGPVWSKDIKHFIEDKPAKKPDCMKLAKFSAFHRSRAALTHFTFSIRKIFWIPLLVLLGAFAFTRIWAFAMFSAGMFLSILLINLLFVIAFPVVNFTRRFILKGIILGLIHVLVMGMVSWFVLGASLMSIAWDTCFHFWIAFFSTMSFSGYTFDTSPREIGAEYPWFTKLNVVLAISGAFLVGLRFAFNFLA